MVASKVSQFKVGKGKDAKTVVITFADVGLENPTIAERAKATANIRKLRTDAANGDESAKKAIAGYVDGSLNREKGDKPANAQKEIPFVIRQKDGSYMRPNNPEMLPNNIFVGAASGEQFFIDKTGGDYAVVHYKSGFQIATGRGRQATINKASSIIARGEGEGKPITLLVKGKEVNPSDIPSGFPLPSSSQPKKMTTSPSRKKKNTSSGASREMKKIINQASVPGLPPQVRYEKLKQAKDYAQQNKMEFPADAQKQLTKVSREVMGMN